jgi:hypothetical protein
VGGERSPSRMAKLSMSSPHWVMQTGFGYLSSVSRMKSCFRHGPFLLVPDCSSRICVTLPVIAMSMRLPFRLWGSRVPFINTADPEGKASPHRLKSQRLVEGRPVGLRPPMNDRRAFARAGRSRRGRCPLALSVSAPLRLSRLCLRRMFAEPPATKLPPATSTPRSARSTRVKGARRFDPPRSGVLERAISDRRGSTPAKAGPEGRGSDRGIDRRPNPESRIPNPESRIPNPESRIPNPESSISQTPVRLEIEGMV